VPLLLRQVAEYLSGEDLSDVRVHYQSNKPAMLGAAAYAQGNDILSARVNRHTYLTNYGMWYNKNLALWQVSSHIKMIMGLLKMNNWKKKPI
jgi:hypothetical protein